MAPGLGKRTYVDRGIVTRKWLIDRNRPLRRALESIYPDLGHGRDTRVREEDQTVTVRREWPARAQGASQPVVWLTTIDGKHNIPGNRGA